MKDEIALRKGIWTAWTRPEKTAHRQLLPCWLVAGVPLPHVTADVHALFADNLGGDLLGGRFPRPGHRAGNSCGIRTADCSDPLPDVSTAWMWWQHCRTSCLTLTLLEPCRKLRTTPAVPSTRFQHREQIDVCVCLQSELHYFGKHWEEQHLQKQEGLHRCKEPLLPLVICWIHVSLIDVMTNTFALYDRSMSQREWRSSNAHLLSSLLILSSSKRNSSLL